MTATLKTEIRGFTGRLIFDNQARKNALTLEMWQALPSAVAELVSNKDVRVIVLSGTQAGPFSAGADISEFEETRSNAEKAAHYDAINVAAFKAVKHCRLPTLAEIRGHCLGGGLGLALACDLRIADDTARFAVPAGRLGLAYPAEAVSDIVAAVGSMAAKRLLFTAEVFGAAQAQSLGILSEVTNGDGLADLTEKICAQIAANAPLTLQAGKLAINALQPGAEKGLMDAAHAAAAQCFNSADFSEGRAAFKEKRSPDFKGI
nr:enoyl-CoA hydratase [Roseibium hamelinense]